MSDPWTTRILSGYRLVERLGEGGFSTVFRAERDDASVAIKVLHPELAADPVALARLERELEALHRLEHPHIVRPLSGELVHRPFPHFAMELLQGRSLAACLQARHPDEAETVRILTAVASALDAAHASGIIHRDLKASNVFLAEPGARPVVLDFGIAKLSEESTPLTRSLQRIGTPACMAPEQVAGGPVTALTDVYALGALLYHLLCGEPPFADEGATVAAQMHRFARRPRPSERGVPPRFDEIVVRAMHLQPEKRYASAGELARAVAAAVAPQTTASGNDRDALALFVRAAPDQEEALRAARQRLLDRDCLSVLDTTLAIVVARVLTESDDRARVETELRGILGADLRVRTRSGRVRLRDGAVQGGGLADLGIWNGGDA